MNAMPIDWLDQLKREYPKRSGPMSWPRVFLKLRRALIETNWDEIMEGVKRYAKYCQDAGTEGSSFVVAPARFFEDEIYLESLKFEQPQTKEQTAKAEIARKESDRMERCIADAARLGCPLRPYPHESATAYEHRLRTEQDNQRSVRRGDALGENIRNLTDRMRIAK